MMVLTATHRSSLSGEIVGYYDKVLEETLLPSGRVQFFGLVDHSEHGADSPAQQQSG